jgi:hypothetical protein
MMEEALTTTGAKALLGCTGVLIFAALLLAAAVVTKKGKSALSARKSAASSKQLCGYDDQEGSFVKGSSPGDMVNETDPKEHPSVRNDGEHQASIEDSERDHIIEVLPQFVLPFHLTVFQDVSFLRQFLCVLWICSFGPILLVLRAVICSVVLTLRGLSAGEEKWLFSGLLGWKVKSVCDKATFPDDGRPFVFLSNHHITYDAAFVRCAVIDRFGFSCKIFVHPKVYNSVVLKNVMGPGRGEIFATSSNKATKFLDMFRDWVQENKKSTEEVDQAVPRGAMVIAPAGMTTHSAYQTPMYWEYFAEKDAVKVLVDVSVTNPFGVNLRALSRGSVLNELFANMMPWLSATVTFYTDVIPDTGLTSQPEVDAIAADMCLKHGKTFAPGWTQKMRRNIDKYFVKEEFTPFPAAVDSACTMDTEIDVKLVDFDGDIPLELKARLPEQTLVVTSSLVDNKQLHEIEGLRVSQIVLINPRTIADEILASVYNIPMAKSDCSPVDAYEAKWSMWV